MEIKLCMLLATMMFILVLIVVGLSIFTINKIENICLNKLEDKKQNKKGE